MPQIIGLKPRVRVRAEPYGLFGRKTRETRVTAYTWTIDGTDIAEWVRHHRQADDLAIPAEETVWLAGNAEDARDRVARLLGQAPPEFGPRTALLTCSECGDLACGAFTAEIGMDGDVVLWRAIGYNDGAAEEPPFLFEPPLVLRFDRDQYVHTLTSALETLSPATP